MDDTQHFAPSYGTGVTRITEVIVMVMRLLLMLGVVALFLGGVVVFARWSTIAGQFGADNSMLPMLVTLSLIGGVIVLLTLFDAILSRLGKILKTVSAGTPFIRENAALLRSIGWFMVGIQIWTFSMFAVTSLANEHLPKMAIKADYEPSGLLSILLAFVLAHVFEQGVAMREDVEGTI